MNRDIIINFLHNIPQSNQDAIHLHKLVPPDTTDLFMGYATLLQTIGLVQLDGLMIKATSQTAKYALMSLSSYVENELPIVADWKTRGVHRDAEAGALQNGATFLFELEKQRVAHLDTPAPSRHEEVVQVIIKRTNPQTGQAELLMQYDANADQYQLIGGRRSPNDATQLISIVREIDEEVKITIIYQQDYQLELIIPKMIIPSTISRTFGALTEYHFTVYHMTGLQKSIELGQDDAWLPLSDLLSDDMTAPQNQSLLQQIDQMLLGGINSLSDSLSI